MRPLLEREFSPIFIFEDLDEAYKEGHGPLRGAILFERGATSPEEGAYLHAVPHHLPASPSQASTNLPTPGGRHLPNHLSYLWEPVLDSLVSFLSPLLPLSRMLRLFILDFDVYQKERDAAKTARMLVPSLLRFFSAHKSWGEGFAPPPLAVNISALRSTSPRLQFSTAPTIRRRLGGEQVARKKKGRENEMS